MLPPPPTCPLSLSPIHPTQQLLLSRGELEKSFRDIKPRRCLGKLSVLCPDNLENRTAWLAMKDSPLVEQVWCLHAPLEATQEDDGLSRAKEGGAGPEACNFRSFCMGGRLLPDLALEQCPFAPSLCFSAPPGKTLSEPLNFRQRRSAFCAAA